MSREQPAQWFKNGDHSQDKSEMISPSPNSTTQFEPFLSEGQVVRYYRHPRIPGNELCPICGICFHDHGWIDTPSFSQLVCPGDYIVQGKWGDYYAYNAKNFAK